MKRYFQRGVSYAEFACGVVVMMMVAFFLVDAAAVLYHYHVLTDRTASFAREIASGIPSEIRSGMSCPDLAGLARTRLDAMAQDSLVSKLELNFSNPLEIDQAANSPYPALTVNGTWRIKCVICRFIGPNLPSLYSTSRVVIEDSKVNLGSMRCQG